MSDEKLDRIKKAIVDANLELKSQETEKLRLAEEEIASVLKRLPEKISNAAKRGQREVVVSVSTKLVAKAINDHLKKVGITATVSNTSRGVL